MTYSELLREISVLKEEIKTQNKVLQEKNAIIHEQDAEISRLHVEVEKLRSNESAVKPSKIPNRNPLDDPFAPFRDKKEDKKEDKPYVHKRRLPWADKKDKPWVDPLTPFLPYVPPYIPPSTPFSCWKCGGPILDCLCVKKEYFTKNKLPHRMNCSCGPFDVCLVCS